MGFLFSFSFTMAATSTVIQDAMNAQNQAFAGKTGANIGEAKDIRIIVANIIRVFLGFVGFLATTYFVYGGYMYMTSAGNEGRASSASKIMLYGALGILIILASYSITTFVYKSFQRSLKNDFTSSSEYNSQNEFFQPN